MKKYFLGLTAIVCALAFSAFTKPFANHTFKLLHDPVSASIVNNPAEWSTTGALFGACGTATNEIACTILLNTSKSTYFHSDGAGGQVLNTFTYANGQSTKQDYLDITEASGLGSDRIINGMPIAKHYNTTLGVYETVDLSTDLSFKNATEVE